MVRTSSRRTRRAAARATACAAAILAIGFAGPARAQSHPKASPSAGTSTAAFQATRAFTYQGLLRGSGLPVNGTCDFQFSLWDNPATGFQLGTTQTVTTTVSNGIFTVALNDAGQFPSSAFDGRALWLEIAVRSPSGSGIYTTLSPRQFLAAAPLASGLVPHTRLFTDDALGGSPAFDVNAPAVAHADPVAIRGTAGTSTYVNSPGLPVGVWGDSDAGWGVIASTNSGIGLFAGAITSGLAAMFNGDTRFTGNILSARFRTTLVLNANGPLPRTSSTFLSGGGTLLLAYSGSGFLVSGANQMIGMTVRLDGTFVDNTAIFANQVGQHMAFVPKTWVLTGIPAGSHTISLSPWGAASTDFNDIFNVTVTELPF